MTRPDQPRSGPGASAGRWRRPAAAPPPEPHPGPITALKEHPRRAGRYVVDIGGVPVGPVSVETIGDLKLRVGQGVDAPALAQLLEAVASTACYDRALDALARKGRPRRDLERFLRQREFAAPAIAAACDRLERLGLLDDTAYAKAYVEGPAKAKGFGTRRVVAELRRRGVASDVVDRENPVSVLRAVTATPGSASPCSSLTCPSSTPLVP